MNSNLRPIPRFGTDGVRGVANVELTPEVVLSLGRAAARELPGGTFLVGRDTRRSGGQLFGALAAGLSAEGADVVDLGVLPTPAVAHASAQRNLPAAMISASHNPFQDNGVKFFSAGGRKLDDTIEQRIDLLYGQLMDRSLSSAVPTSATGEVIGASVGQLLEDRGAAVSLYTEHIVSTLEGRKLNGLHVVVDAANGALSGIADRVLASLGASVTSLHDAPDGVNINAGCGSTHLESLMDEVRRTGADLGLGFDGDADRCLACDAAGNLIDGDQIMAMLALDLRSRSQLKDDTVVVTVMTNLGFKLAMRREGLAVVETKVGDRYVLEALNAGGYSLGGEQSGHVILTRHASTGDGLLTGVAVMDLMARTGRSLASLGSVMVRLPQVLRNVRGVDRSKLDSATGLWDAVRAAETSMGGEGRVLIRPSGTEALVRVMVEAPTAESAESITEQLCSVVLRELA
jgi:phosphoglucosamine mutase